MKGLKPGEFKDTPMPFGKFKGILLADVPNHYLTWLLDQEFVETKFSTLYQMAKIENKYRSDNNLVIED